ncbi:MAG: transposase domain-containing protein [Bacteroidetes bacterium]|nr:transposase domain-containing protein [Bacteroidota bacterium]
MFANCQINGVNPEKWLNKVLARRP